MTTTTTMLPLLAQADLLLLLSRLFRAPTAFEQGWLESARADLNTLLEHTGFADTGELGELLDAALGIAVELPLELWAAEHTRLFECSVACPISETAYVRRDKGNLLADIMGFYRAFGLDQTANASEKADHLACELEFVALLLVMLAQASDDEAAEVTRNALASFAADHLGEWLPGFCKRLLGTTALPLFQFAGAALDVAWRAFCTQHALQVSAGKVLPTVEDDSGTPYECGMADRCEP